MVTERIETNSQIDRRELMEKLISVDCLWPKLWQTAFPESFPGYPEEGETAFPSEESLPKDRRRIA